MVPQRKVHQVRITSFGQRLENRPGVESRGSRTVFLPLDHENRHIDLVSHAGRLADPGHRRQKRTQGGQQQNRLEARLIVRQRVCCGQHRCPAAG